MKSIIPALAVLGAGAGMQMIPRTLPRNPAVLSGRTIEANLPVPAHIQQILNNACRDCHSSETRWPWYVKVAPVSWFVATDVKRARKAVNFSEWSVQAGRTANTAMGTLAAACAGVTAGRMPPALYRLMHPEARLSEEEAISFCTWTIEESRWLRAARPTLLRPRLGGADTEPRP
jgi:hypothetical protein